MDLVFATKLQQITMVLTYNISMKDNKSRSIWKSISWRVLASCDTVLISYLITGSFAIAASIGSIEVLTKMILYYFHERAWNRFEFGRN